MKKVLFMYQNAYSQTGGIQTFNKYFIAALEDITKETKNFSASLVSINDNKEDITSSLPSTTLYQSKLAAFKYIITNAYKYNTFIFAHVNLAPLALLLYILNPKAKLLFCTHGIEIWKKLPKMTEWIMNKSTILTVSSFSKSELLKYNPNLNDIRLFPNCIKLQNTAMELTNPYNKNNYNILSVTRLSSSEQLKGIDTVIKALPSIIKDIPNVKYSIIGKGEDAKRLKALANDLNVLKYIDFLGFVDDINAYYKYCDIFTLPSKKEGFGIVYLEAMQYKKPVIAVNYGGPTDVIENNVSGFLCEYDDTNCLSGKIIELFNDMSYSRKIGENGYSSLIENFTFEKYSNRLKKIVL